MTRLASGAMGVVYLGRVQGVGGFERLFAIKVLHPHLAQKPQIVSMLLTEARLAAQIQHPNVVSVLDVDVTESGEHYVVMDYIDGFTLCELLDHPRLDAVRRVRLGLRILLDATLGLDAAHRLCSPSDGSALGIVHRDVSPNNVLCSLRGTGLIADFGIARVAAEDTDSMPGVIKGTPCYMAPEQVAGSESLDARADVWSLGAVLWEVLTGEQLFYSPDGVGGVLSLVLTGQIPSPSERNSRVPAALDAVCAKALQRDPAQRLASARELAEELKRIAREHDIVASEHETADELARLFAESIEQRRSWFPALTSAAPLAVAAEPAAPALVEVVQAPAEAVLTDAELERLPLRRPPWALIAILACALGAITALVLTDATATAPRRLVEPEIPKAHRAPASAARYPQKLEESTAQRTVTPPPPRNLAFAPAHARVPAPQPPYDTRAVAGGPSRTPRAAGDAGPVQVEPNPYLQR